MSVAVRLKDAALMLAQELVGAKLAINGTPCIQVRAVESVSPFADTTLISIAPRNAYGKQKVRTASED